MQLDLLEGVWPGVKTNFDFHIEKNFTTTVTKGKPSCGKGDIVILVVVGGAPP